MPSTMSSSVSAVLASSAVITPSFPTFCIAFAIMSPIDLSPFAEMVPTCAISSDDFTFLARRSMSFTTSATARSIPRFRSIGFMPAATDFAPSRTMAAASTVAVVVPSPATSLDLEATSRTIWAPMFSNLQESSISFATVTPSLVTRGAPKDLSRTTLRPLGPRVTFTALARVSTPRSMRSRASVEKRTSLAAMSVPPVLLIAGLRGSRGLLAGDRLLDDAHDVGLLHDKEVLAVDAHLGARPFAEQNAVAGLDIERDDLAALVASTRTGGDDLALLRLLLSGVRNDDAALRLLLRLDTADDNPVVQRTKLHVLLHIAPKRAILIGSSTLDRRVPRPVGYKDRGGP